MAQDLRAKNPDDLHGDTVTTYITISTRRNGALTVEGCIHDRVYAIAMLQNAIDAINNHHARNHINSLNIPKQDTFLADL